MKVYNVWAFHPEAEELDDPQSYWTDEEDDALDHIKHWKEQGLIVCDKPSDFNIELTREGVLYFLNVLGLC